MGGKSSSSSASTTYNTDRRVAVQDGIGISGDSNAVSVVTNITDGGIVSRGLDTVDKAIDAVSLSNANNAQGFDALLKTAESLWSRGENLIGQTQQAVADAYSRASNDKAGTIDNRTIIVLAVAGAAALAFAKRRG